MVLDLIQVDFFSLSDSSGLGKNLKISLAGVSSYEHIDNKTKYILFPGKDPTDGLDDTTLPEEKEYFVSFTQQQNKFCLRLNYNQSK